MATNPSPLEGERARVRGAHESKDAFMKRKA